MILFLHILVGEPSLHLGKSLNGGKNASLSCSMLVLQERTSAASSIIITDVPVAIAVPNPFSGRMNDVDEECVVLGQPFRFMDRMKQRPTGVELGRMKWDELITNKNNLEMGMLQTCTYLD